MLSHVQNPRSAEEGLSRGVGSCTCREVEVGARWAVHTLKAAGVETHGLFPLPRLAALGTHGHWDLEKEDKTQWVLFPHPLGSHLAGCSSGEGSLALSEQLLELGLCRTLLVSSVCGLIQATTLW